MGILDKDIKEVISNFKDLKYELKNGLSYLVGKIDIYDNSGNIYYDTFDIEIIIPKNYPFGFPKLFEIGDKIPKIPDRHIYTNDHSCCVCILQIAEMEARNGISIFNYIKKYVIPFFANQIYYENKKEWANGDYKHGFNGILQYYEEILETSQIEIIYSLINTFRNNKISRNEICFCKSGKKFKKCHLSIFDKLSNIPKERLNLDFIDIEKYKNNSL
jgi:hypothetical protein